MLTSTPKACPSAASLDGTYSYSEINRRAWPQTALNGTEKLSFTELVDCVAELSQGGVSQVILDNAQCPNIYCYRSSTRCQPDYKLGYQEKNGGRT